MKNGCMLILLIYEIALILIRRSGMNKYEDNVTDFVIEIIPVVMCGIGALS